jgi:hypothetical protein
MDRFKTARNVAIILVIAAAVYFLPNGGRAANTFGAALSVAFAAGLAFFAGRLYLEHRTTIYGLGDRHRGLLYGALAVGTVTITAQPRMFETAAGELAWFLLIGAVVAALVAVVRRWRAY